MLFLFSLFVSPNALAIRSYESLPDGHKCNCPDDQSFLEQLKCFNLDFRNRFTGEVQRAERLKKSGSVKGSLQSGNFKSDYDLDNYLNAYRKDALVGHKCFPSPSSNHHQAYLNEIKEPTKIAAQVYGLPYQFLTCIAFKESQFELDLDEGPFQIEEGTWNEFMKDTVRENYNLLDERVYSKRLKEPLAKISGIQECRAAKNIRVNDYCIGIGGSSDSFLKNYQAQVQLEIDTVNRTRKLIQLNKSYRSKVKLKGKGPFYNTNQTKQAKESVGTAALVLYSYKRQISRQLTKMKIPHNIDSPTPEFLMLVASAYNAGANGVNIVLNRSKGIKDLKSALKAVQKRIYFHKSDSERKSKSRIVTKYTNAVNNCMSKGNYGTQSKSSDALKRQNQCFPKYKGGAGW